MDWSSALLTPVIAAFAVWITWRQWRTDDLRLKHEQFERRYAVYEQLAGFMASVLQLGKCPPEGPELLLRQTRQSYFLFDDETKAFITEVYKHAARIETLEMVRPTLGPGPELNKNVAGRREEMDWFGKQLQGLEPRFAKYLRVSG
jgi:hypothetical protein